MSIPRVDSAATPAVEITYPELLTLHNQKKATYATAKKSIEDSLGEYEQSCTNIAGFTRKIRERGHQLQHQLSGISTESLQKERTATLKEYEGFKGSCAKLNLLAEGLARAVTFLTPVVRTWTTETQLKENGTLYEQTKESDRICLEYFNELSAKNSTVIQLKERMVSLVYNSEVTWSIQRFCNIVDQDGQPLSLFQRSYNYCFSAVIPPSASISSLKETKMEEVDVEVSADTTDEETDEEVEPSTSTSGTAPAAADLQGTPVLPAAAPSKGVEPSTSTSGTAPAAADLQGTPVLPAAAPSKGVKPSTSTSGTAPAAADLQGTPVLPAAAPSKGVKPPSTSGTAPAAALQGTPVLPAAAPSKGVKSPSTSGSAPVVPTSQSASAAQTGSAGQRGSSLPKQLNSIKMAPPPNSSKSAKRVVTEEVDEMS